MTNKVPMLEVKNLHVTVDGKQILNGLNLTVNKGEVHAIMGPNGSGKSTLSYVMAGKSGYEATAGEILLDGEDVLAMEPDERAAKGLFLAFQYPLEIPGVATMTFLRTAVNAQRKARGEGELSTPEFMKLVRDTAGKLEINPDMLRRVFHSSQVPAAGGFNRVHYRNADVDRLIDAASAAAGDDDRRRLYGEVQQVVARDVPYIPLWYKTNIAVFQPGLHGVRLSPIADFTFLKDVYRSDTR